MPSRKYCLVGDGTAINMRQKLAREKHIRSVSITSSADNVGVEKSNYYCEVSKSPRAPEYVVHYVKAKAEGIKSVKHKPRAVRRPSDKGTWSNCSQASRDDDKLDSETTDQEKDDMVGLRVIACNRQDGLYYLGHVSHTPASAYAIVNFNYHKRQKVRTEMIIPMSGAIPRPELAPGDFVLVRAFKQSKEAQCFVPGIVEVTPEDFRHHAKFYSVLLYNGQRDTTMRKFIVKIGKARFEMAIRYIAHVQQQKILRQESALSDSSVLPSPQSSKRSDDEVSSTRSSTRSSQSGRGRRKKEKITKKIGKYKEKEKYSKSRRKSRSRSRSHSSRSSRSKSSVSSRSRSRSQSSRSQSSRSRSKSVSSRSRSRSGSSRSRSRSGSRSSRSQSQGSRSGSRSSRSVSERSKSRSDSARSRSRSIERSRLEKSKSRKPRRRSASSSRSRSSSSSTVRSRSSVQRSRPKSAAAQRSRSSSRSSRSRSRSKSQGSKGSSTPRAQSPYDRPLGPTPSARRKAPIIRTESMINHRDVTRRDIYSEQSISSKTSKYVNVDEKEEMIQNLQYQLEKQKRKQLRQERRLVRQARKINKIQSKLRDSDVSHNSSGHSTHTDRSDRNKSQRSSSSETDTSPQRRKGSPDGTSYGDSPDLQILRRSSPGLQTNLEVLARWQDDGWYYRGSVVAEGKGDKYVVRDNTGHVEAIHRDDILTDGGKRFDAIQPEDRVIGLHPKYVFSYAPAEVLGTYSNSSVKVEFYDGNIAELAVEDVYKVSKDKYEQVVDYIKRSEKHLIGQSVVAREDHTGLYKLGVVDSRVGLGQQYYIKWLDGDMSKQNGNHIFEVARRQTQHEDWSYVLAPVAQHSMIYMPAEVIEQQPLVVQFCDGKRSSVATTDQCFWLSKEYYSNARGLLMDVRSRKHASNIQPDRD